MKKNNIVKSIILAETFFLLLAAPHLFAQSVDTSNTPKPTENFTLKEGDRVLFVGNSLFENELLNGYLELALTTRWPRRHVTFRNIGWSGDTVWGEARGYFTNPPTPYELLLKQITDARPTVVFVAYGGIEGYAGADCLPDFTKGLNSLIDTIASLGAQTVLLSPIPLFSTNPTEIGRNETLRQYASEMARLAASRGVTYLDIFHPLLEAGKKANVSDNGFHLNESGYYQLAILLDKQLGASSRAQFVSIDVSKKGEPTTETARIHSPGANDAVLQFEISSDHLPLPLPPVGTAQPVYTRLLKITGLRKGFYTLTADGFEIVSASAEQWAKGVGLFQGPDFAEAERLQAMIVEKNKVFFRQYRPHNRTYIIGFRAYEQGRHAEGLQDLSLIITWLEGQIALHRAPVSPMYTLIKLR